MPRHSLAHHGFLPDSPQARYELLLRSLALMLSGTVFNAIEIGIAVRNDKPGSIVNNAIFAGISAFTSLALVFSAWKNQEMASATPFVAKISAMGSAFSAMLAFSAVSASLTSVGNYRFTDGLIEGGVAASALLFVTGFALLQCVNPKARTQTSILDVITCKEAPDQRSMIAGSLLGNIPAFAAFAYFDFRLQRYGSFAGCAVSLITNTGLFVKTLRHTSADSERLFSCEQFMMYATGIAGFLFLCGGLTNYMNGRSAIEFQSELFTGAGLTTLLALYKACHYLHGRWCNNPDQDLLVESEETSPEAEEYAPLIP